MVRLFCGVCRLWKCVRAHTMEIIRIAIKRKRMWNYWVSMCVMVVVVAVAWWNMSTKTISATRWFFMVPTGKILRSSLLFVLCFFFAFTPAMSLFLFSRARFRIFFVYNFTNRINVCVCVVSAFGVSCSFFSYMAHYDFCSKVFFVSCLCCWYFFSLLFWIL